MWPVSCHTPQCGRPARDRCRRRNGRAAANDRSAFVATTSINRSRSKSSLSASPSAPGAGSNGGTGRPRVCPRTLVACELCKIRILSSIDFIYCLRRNRAFGGRPTKDSGSTENPPLSGSVPVVVGRPLMSAAVRASSPACYTVGKPHNIANQTTQRFSYFKPPAVPITLTTDRLQLSICVPLLGINPTCRDVRAQRNRWTCLRPHADLDMFDISPDDVHRFPTARLHDR